MATDIQLNLARKWRAHSFDQLVGQEITVRILKNSLYLNQFFPVYLFAGQRGCGKTSTARIFAAAANCEQLPVFQKTPTATLLPCGACASCLAFAQGKHPDFIEIDAASHTGVDNVRQLIESAAYLPLLGRKKVYLIDEAHMLSRAAFNAFLKVLEEPPASVFFILATTDEHKIIETVKSRCFQLFFGAIQHDALTKHLARICKEESINATQDALLMIAQESSGSARDALNLLEQIRFAESAVTVESLLRVLGRISDEQLTVLLEAVLDAPDIQDVVCLVEQSGLDGYNPEYVWKRFLELIKSSLWATDDTAHAAQLIRLFDSVAAYDPVMTKTLYKQLYLSFFFPKAWLALHTVSTAIADTGSSAHIKPIAKPVVAPQKAVQEPVVMAPPIPSKQDSPWHTMVQELSPKAEPLLASLIKQATFEGFDATAGRVRITLDKKFELFKDMFEAKNSLFKESLQAHFGATAQLEVVFVDRPASSIARPIEPVAFKTKTEQVMQRLPNPHAKTTVKIDTSELPMTHLLLQEFDGTVTEVADL